MVPHFLEFNVDVHLVFRDFGEGVDEVEVGELAVDAVVNNVECSKVFDWKVDYEGGLDGSRLDGEGLDVGALHVVIGVDPGLRTSSAVFCDEKDDVF